MAIQSRQSREPREGYIAVGRVLRPWGLRGDMKVESLTDFPERFDPGESLWLKDSERRIQSSRWQKGALYLKLSGIDDVDSAEEMRDELLEIPEASLHELDDDEFYHHQLIGLNVRTDDGAELGVVSEVLAPAGNAVLVVRGVRGEVLLPFIDEVILSVALAGHQIIAHIPDGLIDDSHRVPRTHVPRARGRRGHS